MYDVIVVGARVAGAPTAMLLARKGYKVLLVDKSTFPSDILSSTLLIWPQSIALLQHWGVLEQLQASHCPPITRYRAYLGAPFDHTPALIIDGAPTPTPLEGISASYAPRRTVLDKLLVDAAVAAGVTLYKGFTVDQVLREEERVVGIRGQTQAGAPVTETATLVIGADGVNSIVARTVSAAEYKTHEPIVLTYYAYWRDVALADGVQVEFCPQDWCAAYAWPTHDGHLLIGTNGARALTEVPPRARGSPRGARIGPRCLPKSHRTSKQATCTSWRSVRPGSPTSVAPAAHASRRWRVAGCGISIGNRLARAGHWSVMPGVVMSLPRRRGS